MFKRLRALFDGKPRVGDLVTVLNGPYAGKAGTIKTIASELSTIYIDECCQPQLMEASLRRVRSSRRSLEPGEPEQGVDEEHEVARARINQLPPPMH